MTRCFNVRYDGEISHVEAESNGPLSLGSQHRDLLISPSPSNKGPMAPASPKEKRRSTRRSAHSSSKSSGMAVTQLVAAKA